MEISKNLECDITIDGMGTDGEGVGRINGIPVFVKGAIDCEKVRIKIIKVCKKYCIGKLLYIIETSKQRCTPKCTEFNRCGGCSIQHMTYEKQLEFKRKKVEDCIRRIAKNKNTEILPVIGMEDNPYRYRNKVQLPVGYGKCNENIYIGFYANKTHEIIDIDNCLIQFDEGDTIIKLAKEWLNKYNILPYNEKDSSGIIRHIMVRKGYTTGEIMLVLVTNKPEVPHINEFIQLVLNNISNVKSIMKNINNKNTNVILGDTNVLLYGDSYITDYIDDFRFKISPLSFFQVNPVQTKILYEKAMEFANLTGNEIVFDAYCGTGTISLFLSRKAKIVYGVEIVKEAIDAANENAIINDIKNVEFLCGKCEKIIPKLIEQGIKADVVVVDPPRRGCDRSLLNAIADMQPCKIVYVSCDPATLSRDIQILYELNYQVEIIQPVDMFPQTSSIETVCMLKKQWN